MTQSPSTCVLVLLDGLGDRSYPELDYRTPLQAARTPNLDKLAAMGASGLMHCGRQGMALPSEDAHFALFGYEPDEFPGRGYFEALGAGIPIAEHETAFLVHLSQLHKWQDTLILVKDRPRVDQSAVAPLFAAIKEYSWKNTGCRLVPTRGVDAILVFDAPSSRYVTDTLPVHERMPLIEPQPLAGYQNDPAAVKTAAALKAYLLWAHRVLSDHPINKARQKEGKVVLNGLSTFGGGQQKTVENFYSRWGLKGISIASGLMYWGLRQYIGLDASRVKDSDDPGQDIYERLMQARAMVDEYEFVHVHTKVPDEASHTKDYRNKVKGIEALDQGIGRALGSLLNDEIILIITSDHSTPSSGPLIHSGEPVPITMVGKGIRCDNIQHFNEVDCAGGALGFVQGRDLMYMVLNALDRVKLSGLRDTPVDQPFWPGFRTPLRLR